MYKSAIRLGGQAARMFNSRNAAQDKIKTSKIIAATNNNSY
jgi:hypothetical protein